MIGWPVQRMDEWRSSEEKDVGPAWWLHAENRIRTQQITHTNDAGCYDLNA